MDLPLGSIFTALTACMTILLTAAYQIYKKDSKNKGFVSCLLLLGLATFWLILFYSIYFLLAISMKMFDQPIAPSLIRMLWPSSLLPYAPLYLAAFSWWHSYLMTLYWLFDDYETNEERESYREFHFNMLKKISQMLGDRLFHYFSCRSTVLSLPRTNRSNITSPLTKHSLASTSKILLSKDSSMPVHISTMPFF